MFFVEGKKYWWFILNNFVDFGFIVVYVYLECIGKRKVGMCEFEKGIIGMKE